MLRPLSPARPPLLAAAAAALVLALAGCVSLGGGEPPESLLTLHSTASAPEGAGARAGAGAGAGAILVMTPEAPAKLDVLRVPVAVSETEIAYLREAYWVEKPARLFRRLLGETLRTRTDALVIDSDDTPTEPRVKLRGTLIDMGYDASARAAVVRFDAVRTDIDGGAVSRRFEAIESGVEAEAAAVGPALNRAANRVAADIADWVATEG
ncbi:ABC-type transport auxiliary lipoprotein family protein [Erythrobacter sp. HL-111]|uniref:ABC-type transport auxiliary lipoprotein family protein n=1 Tax=Erythrobacter sp. HL-111 TaxID=1798193 RepID=UPI0006D9E69D|nr:ABC-type transport auxiliary lipoprotein family protein [Erythrobacter sp. HL-111]KPP88100.1 MAG: gamma-hexachlorocyclohexane transport system accessory component LinN [Erythrobacteraceae bacterium HL-111]SDT09099.1 cholesterol transport system auxiliary component [Erythrobacter sp. HL-111]